VKFVDDVEEVVEWVLGAFVGTVVGVVVVNTQTKNAEELCTK
jgi:hypothetical protein